MDYLHSERSKKVIRISRDGLHDKTKTINALLLSHPWIVLGFEFVQALYSADIAYRLVLGWHRDCLVLLPLEVPHATTPPFCTAWRDYRGTVWNQTCLKSDLPDFGTVLFPSFGCEIHANDSTLASKTICSRRQMREDTTMGTNEEPVIKQ